MLNQRPAEEENRFDFENQALKYYFENTSECLVIVDSEGFIVNINNAYAKFLDIRKEDAIGEHVTDIIENTRLHIVVKTGKPEIAEMQVIREHESITSRIPLFKDGVVIGAIGEVVFKNCSDIEFLNRKMAEAKRDCDAYKERLIKIQGYCDPVDNIIGNNMKILKLKEIVRRISNSDSTVLITGETGTGKEIFANAIQETSKRKNNNFVKINCAAIPENILESELFGYEDGAFTGARKGGKIGKFELAGKGTIFLDEIGDMGIGMQSKILRVLQEKIVERVGGNTPKSVDIRVIAATNQDLVEKINRGEFREDLYFRLNVISIETPPLRERLDDLPLLCEYFIEKFNKKFGIYIEKIEEDAMECFENYTWPGNIRELENTIESAYHFVESNCIGKNQLPEKMTSQKRYRKTNLARMVQGYEKEIIRETLETCGGNKSKAAKALEINRSNLYQKMAKYQLL